ncbi:hypothetical protein IX51_03990 [uncultured archaeon]|nr:hypothetical protein IX51_03990 [uncultured archaeon]
MTSIGELEKQSGILRITLFLRDKDEYLLSRIWPDSGVSINQGYKALEKLKDLGIIKARIESSSYPPKNLISLTEKGKKVAEKLKELEELLG